MITAVIVKGTLQRMREETSFSFLARGPEHWRCLLATYQFGTEQHRTVFVTCSGETESFSEPEVFFIYQLKLSIGNTLMQSLFARKDYFKTTYMAFVLL